MKILNQKLIENWKARGVVDHETANRLQAELGSGLGRFNASSSLMGLAVIFLIAALTALIASNWELLPRLARLAIIAACISAGYGIGGWLAHKNTRYMHEFLYLFGLASFGIGMALTAQMYHISGDEIRFYQVWAGVALICAVLLQAKFHGIAGTLLAIVALFYGGHFFEGSGLPWWYFAGALLAWAASCLLHSVWMRSIILVTLFPIAVDFFGGEQSYALWIVAVIGIFMMFLGRALRNDAKDFFGIPKTWLDAHWSDIGFFYTIVALALLQMIFDNNFTVWIMAVCAMFAVTIAIAVLTPLTKRDMRVKAYGIFVLQVFYVLNETVGTLLDTSAFFLVAAILMLVLAFGIRVFERKKATL